MCEKLMVDRTPCQHTIIIFSHTCEERVQILIQSFYSTIFTTVFILRFITKYNIINIQIFSVCPFEISKKNTVDNYQPTTAILRPQRTNHICAKRCTENQHCTILRRFYNNIWQTFFQPLNMNTCHKSTNSTSQFFITPGLYSLTVRSFYVTGTLNIS